MNTNEPQSVDAGARDARNVVLHARYIKDFSFENPGAPGVPSKDDLRIDISVRVEGEQRRDLHEVVLTLTATAVHEAEIVFLVELSYAGLFELIDLDEESRERFIFCEAPRLLFPWVDRIVADVTRDGGLPSLNLTQPDFVGLYERERTAS